MKFKEQVIIKGKAYEIDKNDVVNVLKNMRPDRIRKFYIEANENKYPVTQALAATVKLPKAFVGSNVALLFLSKIGFEIKENF
ncbi:MAG: hypothetical protein KKE50_00135, partial [Nanoarchaeota archaeon]|nr:hypothetical protein [Nanoarchaeota archaeon]